MKHTYTSKEELAERVGLIEAASWFYDCPFSREIEDLEHNIVLMTWGPDGSTVVEILNEDEMYCAGCNRMVKPDSITEASGANDYCPHCGEYVCDYGPPAEIETPLELVENPDTGEVFLYSSLRGIIQAFNGTTRGIAFVTVQDWERIILKQAVPSLFDWRKDPGLYSDAHYVYARIDLCDRTHFTAGGSFLQVMNWNEDFGSGVTWLKCFRDRNLVGQDADVQW